MMITAIDKQTALVLIDLQKGILGMEMVHPVKGVLGKSAQLVDAFRNAGLPVVIVNADPTGFAKIRAEQARPPMTVLPAGFMDIAEEIKTQPHDIFITKCTWSAFYNTPLHNELQKRSITGIVLAGVATSIGVEGTARAAAELGYNVSFATDAMTDRDAGAHKNSLSAIFPGLGEQGTSADIITQLQRR
ncbi:MAG: isochorismatase family protein [Bacteroidia bacterium]